MTVTLDGTTLWQAQEASLDRKGNVRTDAIYGEDSDNTLLTGLESIERIEYAGEATGLQLSLESGYSDDPLTALAEFALELEAFVDAKQGTGYTLSDDTQNSDRNVVLESAGWVRNVGEKYSLQWDISGYEINGMMPDVSSAYSGANPSLSQHKIVEGGTTIKLQGVQSYRQQKTQQIEPYPIAYANAGENEALAKSGAVKEIFIRGQRTGSFTEMANFDSKIVSRIGKDIIVDFEEAFPGRTEKVMIRKYEGTLESGRTRIGEYMLEMVEGTGGTNTT